MSEAEARRIRHYGYFGVIEKRPPLQFHEVARPWKENYRWNNIAASQALYELRTKGPKAMYLNPSFIPSSL